MQQSNGSPPPQLLTKANDLHCIFRNVYIRWQRVFDSARPHFSPSSDFCSVFPLIIPLSALSSSLLREVGCTASLRYVSRIEAGQSLE